MSKKKRSSFFEKTAPLEYEYHQPVLLRESVDFLVTSANGIYIDGTLGGGGHAALILSKLSDRGKLLAFDKDEEAIRYCSNKFSDELAKGENSRLIIRNDCYSKACSEARNYGEISGILLDLGVSSRQLDDSSKGFSYRAEGKLDMRFSQSGLSAVELINTTEEEFLYRILKEFGEEPRASIIARRICQRRRASSFSTTFDLKDLVSELVPPQFLNKTLSRVFQAIRIAVNEELTTLDKTLKSCIAELISGGRIVVIAYHSLEDRIVKNIFREESKSEANSIPFKLDSQKRDPYLKIITKKPITPSSEEISLNPRARSAKMRVAEKL
jgi:16S rRNA (cytosine1402-N4)-methyltransferase